MPVFPGKRSLVNSKGARILKVSDLKIRANFACHDFTAKAAK